MSNDQDAIKYVKHNKVRIKADVNRDEITKMLLEFFEEIKEPSTGMKGFMVMDHLQYLRESTNPYLLGKKRRYGFFI
jgi:hypothetical protein